jgi:transposase
MDGCQADPLAAPPGAWTLQGERLGPLPLISAVLERIGLSALLGEALPPAGREALPPARALGVLLRSVLVEREPIYRQQETVERFSATAFGVTAAEAQALRDDQLGRALDRLFAADRGTLLTAIVLRACQAYGVSCTELHNDSTTIKFTGQYRTARGRRLFGRRAPWITYGHSKDHRPDLKQLLWILTTTADGSIPVQFRCADGNTSDASTHIATWDALAALLGRPDFLYVADSKFCTRETMDHVDRRRGRFITVLPRTRREDELFREGLQTQEPAWEEVWNRPNPRRRGGPRDIWWVCRDPIPSVEGWPIIWVWSSLGALQAERARRERLTRAQQDLTALQQKLRGPKPRWRSPAQLKTQVQTLLRHLDVERFITVELGVEPEHRYVQAQRGRPGPQTRYRRLTRVRLTLAWSLNEPAIVYEQKSDGMYPLLTNDRQLPAKAVLEAHKRQPALEKRFEQLKTDLEIAPVFLKNAGRVAAFCCIYFLALLVQALIEREVRRAMQREGLRELALYPEQRASRRPTATQIFRLFSAVARHAVVSGTTTLRVFEPELTELQRQVLHLLGVPERVYRSETAST